MSARKSGRKRQRTLRYSSSAEIDLDDNIDPEEVVNNNVSDEIAGKFY